MTHIDAEKVLFDDQNRYYDALQMQGVPYFIFYDHQGNYLYHIQGYNTNYRSYYVDFIRQAAEGGG